MRLYAFAFFVSSDITQGKWEKRSFGKTFADENSRFGINDRGEIFAVQLHVRRTWCRALDWRSSKKWCSVGISYVAFATHNTVGNSPLPRLTMLLLGQYALRPALRHRSRKRFVIVSAALLLLARTSLFLENTFLPHDFGTRSRRKCQSPLYQHNTPATLLYRREFPIYRTLPTDPFGAIRHRICTLLSVTIPIHSDIYIL